MSPKAADLSVAQARRIALGAQGFTDARPGGRVTARHFQRVLDRTGLAQIDSVNVLVRAHYMPFYSRLGPYDRAALDRYTWGSGRMFEYWAHEASLLPVERLPLMRHRMENGRSKHWAWHHDFFRSKREFVDEILERVRAEGALQVGEVNDSGSQIGWWNWSEAKVALEALYARGRLAVGRRRNFARLYDLPERVFPPQVLAAPYPDEEEAHRELLLLAARHHGIGTARDLADYYRVNVPTAKKRIAELVDAGALQQVTVEGWREPAYLHPEARIPRRVEARALLSPFDPVVWERSRTERLFDFHYRIEIYVPEPKRQFGYYVLPLLLGDALVGRVDLKADRQGGRLLVRAAHVEAGRDPAEVADALAAELVTMAEWLGLEQVMVEPRGDLAPVLKHALKSAAGGRIKPSAGTTSI